MYQDQHSVLSLGTTRVLSQNQYAYEEFLFQLLGREFRLANPAEIRGPNRVKATFASNKQGSGEHDAPRIDLWIEFNPAMGLYTIWGEYWNKGQLVMTSSPRSGDDEMLARPARIFDWLVQFADGKDVGPDILPDEAFAGMMTPAGAIESIENLGEQGCGCAYKLEPEFRLPQAYFTSGTEFPGPYGGPTPFAASLTLDDWQSMYESPVRDAVQRTADNLYGAGAYKVSVDAYGFVLMVPLQPIPQQQFFTRGEGNLPPMSAPEFAVQRAESKSWFASEVLRMAGVDGRERLQDRRLDEKYSGGTIPILGKPKGKAKTSDGVTPVLDKPKRDRSKAPEGFRIEPPTKKSPKSHKELWSKIYTSSGEGDDAQTARIIAKIVLRSGGKAPKKKQAEESVMSIENRMRALLGEGTGDGAFEKVDADNFQHLEVGNTYKLKMGRDRVTCEFVGWVDANGRETDSEDPAKVELQFRESDGETFEAYWYASKKCYAVGSSADALYVKEA